MEKPHKRRSFKCKWGARKKAWRNGKAYFVLGHKDSISQRYKFCKLIYKFNVTSMEMPKGLFKARQTHSSLWMGQETWKNSQKNSKIWKVPFFCKRGRGPCWESTRNPLGRVIDHENHCLSPLIFCSLQWHGSQAHGNVEITCWMRRTPPTTKTLFLHF